MKTHSAYSSTRAIVMLCLVVAMAMIPGCNSLDRTGALFGRQALSPAGALRTVERSYRGIPWGCSEENLTTALPGVVQSTGAMVDVTYVLDRGNRAPEAIVFVFRRGGLWSVDECYGPSKVDTQAFEEALKRTCGTGDLEKRTDGTWLIGGKIMIQVATDHIRYTALPSDRSK